MCGIVEGGSRHKKQGGGEGEGVVCRGYTYSEVGSKPGLETVQGLPLFPGAGCPIRVWSGGRMTSVCTVSCTRGCCSCVCCSFCGLICFLLAVVGIQNQW